MPNFSLLVSVYVFHPLRRCDGLRSDGEVVCSVNFKSFKHAAGNLAVKMDGVASFAQRDVRRGHLGLRVLITPPQSPQANALCERLIGTLRRECLDFIIPLTETHLRCLLHEWATHYTTGRPHMALGSGIHQPLVSLPAWLCEHRHRWLQPYHVVARPILRMTGVSQSL
jgi:Integrase core domain